MLDVLEQRAGLSESLWQPGKRILDIGAGHGFLDAFLTARYNVTIYGFDVRNSYQVTNTRTQVTHRGFLSICGYPSGICPPTLTRPSTPWLPLKHLPIMSSCSGPLHTLTIVRIARQINERPTTNLVLFHPLVSLVPLAVRGDPGVAAHDPLFRR